MKRRNFFKALAAVAVIPILPETKKEFKYIEFDCKLSRVLKHYSVQGDGHYVGMWSPKGAISFPRHGVNSREYIDRHI